MTPEDKARLLANLQRIEALRDEAKAQRAAAAKPDDMTPYATDYRSTPYRIVDPIKEAEKHTHLPEVIDPQEFGLKLHTVRGRMELNSLMFGTVTCPGCIRAIGAYLSEEAPNAGLN